MITGQITGGMLGSGSRKCLPGLFRFKFTDQSPSPSNFKIIYTDSSKKFWIDGVEYASGTIVALTPDAGDINHYIRVESAEITEVNFLDTHIMGTIDDMQSWALTGSANFSSTNVSGDIANTGWALTGSAYFSSTNVSGDIANTGWTLTGSAYFDSTNVSGDIANTGWALTGSANFNSTNVSGDIANTGWALTGSANFSSTNVSGDIANTGWALTGYANFSNSQVNDCLSPLTGWDSLNVNFNGCPLSTSAVDNIVEGFDTQGNSNGTIDLGNTSPPSSTGMTYINNLIAKGWTVTHD